MVTPPDEAVLERLGDEIAELAAHVHAATYQLLVRLREFDERGGWWCGFKSCARWLSWRTGIAPGAARENVRVARALAALPLLSDAMKRGELSYAKIRAATRVATPENEQHLLELARHGTAAHVEKVVRAWRRVNRLEELHADGERHEKRHLTLYIDDDGSYVIRGRQDPEVGALLESALDAAELALYSKSKRERTGGPTHLHDPVTTATPVQRRADALALLAETALRSDALAADAPNPEDAERLQQVVGRAGRFQVVVHVDAEALAEGSDTGQSVLGEGLRVPQKRRDASRATRAGWS